MKLLILAVAISLAVLASGSYVPSTKFEAKYADKEFLFKQKFFFEVLRNIHLPLKYDEYIPYTKTWVSDETKYNDFAQVAEFFDWYKTGAFLEKGELFSIYNEQYLRQTYAVFTFLYNSADWDTYYKNMIWARDNINEGMFIYVLHLTVMHRPDLQGIFYFIITPYTAKTYEQGYQYDKTFTCGVESGMRFYDSLPFGYPFDRVINFNYFYTKNMYFKDVFIFHTEEMKMNQTY
uniref:Hemocyanin N-terminal domain-containing protein n=1 Tax=Anopheles melas TaxID=34690 RepID=A0A182UJ37_9DIPT